MEVLEISSKQQIIVCYSIKSWPAVLTATGKHPVRIAPEAVKDNISDVCLLCAPVTPRKTEPVCKVCWKKTETNKQTTSIKNGACLDLFSLTNDSSVPSSVFF